MIGVGYGINAGIVWCFDGRLGTVFNGDTDIITLGLDKRIKIDSSKRCFYGCNDGHIEGLVTGGRYGINPNVC